ncbi:unnamed protein product [Blepharisma stoltei]|uniref:Uncharacterized protein n=1 Tax=Blepharisma stoltei TaxID=1481888 RepID=A0AAU9JUZ9_9CILI|nr:unnamed protein product [Blepharisma stoltei]
MAEQLKRKIDSLGISNKTLSEITNLTGSTLDKVLKRIRIKWINDGQTQKIKLKQLIDDRNSEETDKETQQALLERRQKEEEEKAIAALKLTKKLNKEMKEREERLKERENEMLRKIQEEVLLEEKLKEEMLLEKDELKRQQLKELQEKSRSRKKEIALMKEIQEKETKKILSEKPLYQKLDELYTNEILMPELERKKAELAKKRMLFKPLDHNELAEYEKRHDEMLRECEERRRERAKQRSIDHIANSASLDLKSKFYDNILEEEKKLKEEKEKEFLQKKLKLEKQLLYSEIIKEAYSPIIDPAKQKEMKLLIEKLKHDPFSARHKKSINSWSERRVSEGNQSIHSRKWKENPMVPKLKPPREPIFIDYLAEKRKERENSDSPVFGRNAKQWVEGLADTNLTDRDRIKIKAKAAKLERYVQQQEVKLEFLDPYNGEGIKAANDLNDMLVSSIKAKLALLEKV